MEAAFPPAVPTVGGVGVADGEGVCDLLKPGEPCNLALLAVAEPPLLPLPESIKSLRSRFKFSKFRRCSSLAEMDPVPPEDATDFSDGADAAIDGFLPPVPDTLDPVRP